MIQILANIGLFQTEMTKSGLTFLKKLN